jgi:NTE family protein
MVRRDVDRRDQRRHHGGQRAEDRLLRLHEFWNTISRPTFCGALANGRPGRVLRAFSAWQTVVQGQPAFFQWHTRTISPWLAPPGTPAAMSYYVADQLRQTLDEIVDLERINRGSIRLSLGAVKVTTGEQIYFDSRTQRIGYQHIMAIAALPPSFPPIEIDRGWYWDGGIVSNTPLDAIIDQLPKHPLLHG